MINREEKDQSIAQQVIDLVNEVRIRMPRLGGKKTLPYFKNTLKKLKVGRDKFFDILRD